jgi:outer membrane receptor protein involved in Fe transport
MTHTKAALFGAAATAAIFMAQSGVASAAAAAAAPAGSTSVTEVIVTAQKRQENIQNVGMSIQAASGDKLTKLGITDTASLVKIVPGFVVTPNYYGTVVYTIRGVGFQDTSLAGSPTVTVYQDEVPLPFSILTAGATLDLQRVEVLKGPQGTLFGDNATAGAINYIANKPTDTFQAGGDVTVGNYSTANVNAYVSGPLFEGFDARLAVQYNSSGAWQKGYAQQAGQSTGGNDFLNGRLAFQWKPTDKFRALLTLSGWQDKGYNQVGQLYGLAGGRNHQMPDFLLNYPNAPHTPQAAGWLDCVNQSPFDPIAGQQLGDQYYTPIYPDGTASPTGKQTGITTPGYPTDPADIAAVQKHGLNAESQGFGSSAAVLRGAPPTDCVPMRRNNDFYDISLRMDYDLAWGMTVTTLTSWNRFNRHAAVDGAGVPMQDYQSLQIGKIEDIYQEVRLSGKFWDNKGNWIIGGNYQYDNTWDRFLQTYNGSTASPTAIPYASLCAAGGCTPEQTPGNAAYDPVQFPAVFLMTLGPTQPANFQIRHTYAVFGHLEYPLLSNLNLLGGVRYTEADLTGGTCGADGGDGSWSTVAQQISNLLQVLSGTTTLNQYIDPAATGGPGFQHADGTLLKAGGYGINAGPHGCGTTGPAPLFLSLGNVFPGGTLNQHNVSWTTGLNWRVLPQTMLYVTFSQGYKGGSFPTVAMSSSAQATPVRQENLISYEGGFKGTWLDNQVTLNGAGFYYDYTDKQILGAETDPVFGPLAELVNVPKSHVIGFEVNGVFTPHFLEGLTVTPAVSYQASHIDKCTGPFVVTGAVGCNPNGHFVTPDAFSRNVDVFGQAFPSAPFWQASLDAEYDWKIHNDIGAFVGLTVTYDSDTHTGFQDPNPPAPGTSLPAGVPGGPCGGVVLCYDPSDVPAYTLLDLRAGIERGPWRLQFWAHNVTNQWYWTAADRVNDTILRYTGMPTTYGFTFSYHYR